MKSNRSATSLFILIAWTAVSSGLPTFLEIGTSHDPHHGHDERSHVDKHVAEHVEHGATPQHEGVNGECPGNQSANSVAVGLMAGVILMPVLVYMTMTKAAKGMISDLTFRMIDLSTSIFLAVLWFSASDDILASPIFKKAFPHAEEVFAILQVFLLYGLTMFVAYAFRDNKYYLLTFCGCAGHYIAFAAIKATGESQHAVGQTLHKENRIYASVGFCFVVFAIFVGMSLVCFFTWRRYVKSDHMHLAIEELELDIVGLVLSFAIMQAFRHGLTGHYPAQAHMLLQQYDVNSGIDCEMYQSHGHVQHTAAQRAIMLAFSVVLTLIAMFSLRKLEELKEKSHYWMHKVLHTVQVVMIMCVAWGYLLWGEWQFYETYFHGDKMFGKMLFAVLATMVSLLIIIGLGFATTERFSNAKGYANLCIMAISLVAAWSWEHCFHTAIDVIAEQYQVGYGGLVPKICIALCIPLIILPGYIIFLKPIVVEVNERVSSEEEALLKANLSEVMYTSSEEGGASEAGKAHLI